MQYFRQTKEYALQEKDYIVAIKATNKSILVLKTLYDKLVYITMSKI